MKVPIAEVPSVGIREFRAALAEYIEADTPVTVTRHGQAVGLFVPLRRPNSDDVQRLQKAIVTPVPANSDEPLRVPALARIGPCDQHDGQLLACALLLDGPIWTEDRDFFGTGVATWKTALVELYFADAEPGPAEH